MPHPLESIYALQKKDRKLMRITREINDIPKRKRDIEARLIASKTKMEQAVGSCRHTEASLHNLEGEVKVLQQRVMKYRQQQMEAKTNEQYRAFVKEICSAEDEIKELEDQEISLMEVLEVGQQIEAGCREQLNNEMEGIADELAELDARADELQERVDEMRADRARTAENCDKDLLQRYTRIFNNKRDVAVVMVETGGHCGGCHMKLPPQVVNDARNPSKIAGCNFCGRMVYNPPGNR